MPDLRLLWVNFFIFFSGLIHMNHLLFSPKSNKQIALALLAANIVYLLMAAVTMPQLSVWADGLTILDMRSGGYTAQDAAALYTALGSTGRHYYLFPQLFLDSLYPALFALAYTWLIVRMLRQSVLRMPKCFAAIRFLPLLTAACDYAENSCTFIGLSYYPVPSPVAAQLGSLFTRLKLLFGMSSFAVIVLLVVIWLMGRFRYKK